MTPTLPVLIPISSVSGRLDNEDPSYVFGAPDIYLALALAYDCLAAPGLRQRSAGVIDPDYANMQPRLAVRWFEEGNRDWTVKLRQGVHSHAGNELTAYDLEWGLAKALAHHTLGAWRWRDVVGVEKLEILDRHTLRYRLRASYPTFPNWLLSVTPNVADSIAIRAHGTDADPWGFGFTNSQVAGFGPYALDAMDSNRLSFTRRSDYWTEAPDAQRIDVQKWPDRQSAIRSLDDASPVIIIGTDPDETTPLLNRQDLVVHRAWAGHTSVEIDFTQPPFSDQRVRQALAHATPYQRLLTEGLLDLGRAWHSPVKRTSQWYSHSTPHYSHDVKRARQLLAEAGFSTGIKTDFYLDRRPDCQRMAEIIASAWADIGIELVLKDIAQTPVGWVPPLQLRTECAHNLSEPIYDIAHDYAAISPIVPPPGGPVGIANWKPRMVKNERAIEIYADMLLEQDPLQKRTKFDDLQSFLADFCSSIFIAENQHAIVANQAVPPSLLAPDSRLFVALMTQNCSSRYLPPRAKS